MRLIDADSLEKDAAEFPHSAMASAFVKRIEEAPTVDAVQVVRCRDCRHRAYQFEQDHYCRIVSNIMPDDGYCSQGEKNENA